jgi:hypothetical protein
VSLVDRAHQDDSRLVEIDVTTGEPYESLATIDEIYPDRPDREAG